MRFWQLFESIVVFYVVLSIVLLLFAVSGTYAQSTADYGASEPSSDKPAPDPDREADSARQDVSWRLPMGSSQYGVEVGFAPTQPTFFSGHKEYNTSGRQFAMASFRIGHIVGTRGPVTYQYLFEAIPLSLAIKNETMAAGSDESHYKTMRTNTYALGIEPLGFRFLFRPHHRVKPYAQTGMGFIFSTKPIPVPEGLPYNFIGDFGGGVMYSVTPTRLMNFGYRYFHISNMNLGKLNPGYNANVFYLGYSFLVK